MMDTLNILQYNVHKSRDVMAALLENPAIAEIDVIALQEPWQNREMLATYCPGLCNFWPFYSTQDETRACFLINKKLKLATYDVSHPREGVTILSLHHRDKQINIVNIYSKPPESLTDSRDDSPIHELESLVPSQGNNIFLGDFNVHHEQWGGIEVGRPHELALTLIDKMEALDLMMITPQGKKTYDYHGHKTTIDLIMADETLTNRVLQCDIDETLKSGSDHRPIKTIFMLTSTEQDVREGDVVHGQQRERGGDVVPRTTSLNPQANSAQANVEQDGCERSQSRKRIHLDPEPPRLA